MTDRYHSVVDADRDEARILRNESLASNRERRYGYDAPSPSELRDEASDW